MGSVFLIGIFTNIPLRFINGLSPVKIINKQLFDISKNTDFAELCITSHAEISEFRGDSIEVKTIKAKGTKCPTCWKIRESKCLRPLCANV